MFLLVLLSPVWKKKTTQRFDRLFAILFGKAEILWIEIVGAL